MARTPVVAPQVVGELRLPPHFIMVFFAIVGLTVLCLAISLTLAFAKDTPATKEVISGCLTMAKIGFGAIVGLIGGKAL